MSFELDFVEWLQHRIVRSDALTLGIGDDMAVLTPPALPGNPAPRLLFASDMLLDGVHFDARSQNLGLIGRKAVACSLSDCAAMAVRPLAVTVSLALPTAMSLAEARALFDGMASIAKEYDVAVAGGDTTRWEHPLAIDVAVTATPYPVVGPVPRSGARIGDTLLVTGPLGGSLLGRHLTFTPRVHEARRLAETLGSRLHAMMDISDGLSLDAWRLCRASRAGAVLDETMLLEVISDDARRASSMDQRSPMEHALGDGEDFELLFAAALAPDSLDQPTQGIDLGGVRSYPVGSITADGFMMRRTDGAAISLEPQGFVH